MPTVWKNPHACAQGPEYCKAFTTACFVTPASSVANAAPARRRHAEQEASTTSSPGHGHAFSRESDSGHRIPRQSSAMFRAARVSSCLYFSGAGSPRGGCSPSCAARRECLLPVLLVLFAGFCAGARLWGCAGARGGVPSLVGVGAELPSRRGSWAAACCCRPSGGVPPLRQ